MSEPLGGHSPCQIAELLVTVPRITWRMWRVPSEDKINLRLKPFQPRGSVAVTVVSRGLAPKSGLEKWPHPRGCLYLSIDSSLSLFSSTTLVPISSFFLLFCLFVFFSFFSFFLALACCV